MALRRAAVVGAGLGGLSAALHLALDGVAVDLYEANDRVGGRANRLELPGGFTFDTGPSLLNYPWLFQALFRRAGRELSDFVELLSVEPALSFTWEDGTWFRLTSDLVALGDECERLDPGGRVGLARFLADAGVKYRLAFDKLVTRNEDNPAKWLFGLSAMEAGRLSLWRSLAGELGRFFKSPRIVEALGCYAMYLGGSPYQLPGFFSLLPYGEIAHGLWLPRGGMYGLIAAVEQLVRDAGVTIHTGAPVASIAVRHGRAVGVELGGGVGGAGVGYDVVVSNLDRPATDTRLLAGAPGAAGRARQAARTRMTPGVTTFYWGLRRQVPSLPHHTVFLPKDYRRAFDQLAREERLPDELPFYIAVASETDAGLAPPGGSTVFVLVPTPVLSRLPGVNWDELVQELERRVFARLAAQGIDLTPADIAEREVWTPLEWQRRFGLYDGSAFGAAHTLFQVGPFRARNYSREIGGLYYVGASTTPGTGLPMVALSGQLVAERVRAREGWG